jgi:transcriptional regulator GlxA family with amidase domain/pimeloyl-ACP methyl ester carboxylesterase
VAATAIQRVVAVTAGELSSFEFGIAAAVFGAAPTPNMPWYDFRVVAEEPTNVVASGGVRANVHGGLEELRSAHVVIVPGWADPTQRPSPQLADALRQAHRRGAFMMSICSGAFALAESGILDGRQATTHWSRAELFARRYPRVTLVPDALYVDAGTIMTSAGGAAGLDLLLHYIRRQHGVHTANLLARQLVAPPHRQGRQVQFVSQPVAAVPPDRLAAVIDWMTEHFREPLSIRELAGRAVMSERTFMRRFRQATGRSPIEWLINLRVARAKALLEESRLPIESIAAQAGFADADALRRHLRSIAGSSPRSYREKMAGEIRMRDARRSNSSAMVALLVGICCWAACAFAPVASGENMKVQPLSLANAPVGPHGGGQPLILEKQGSFIAGGARLTAPNGETFHGDGAYVSFQIPQDARELPLVMWHGGGQFGKTWESTPDGRDGFQQIFTRRGFSTYVIDQPRRGRAGRSSVGTAIPDALSSAAPPESMLYNLYRIGVWEPPNKPQLFANVQFPKDPASLAQYWLQMTPNTGPEDRESVAAAGVELFKKIGPGILVSHSVGARYGWLTALKAPDLVKAIVSYEAVFFVFPSDDLPPDVPTADPLVLRVTTPEICSPAEFRNLTKMPIQIVFGDYIEFDKPSRIAGVEMWRVAVRRAKQFVETVNRHGGRAQIVFLPEKGLRGNTHFPFSDLNNVEVADLLAEYLSEQGLDGRARKASTP